MITATQEAEAGESLEPRRWRLLSQDHAIALQPGQQSETPSPLLQKRVSAENGTVHPCRGECDNSYLNKYAFTL